MKRSEINAAYHDAKACFARHSWSLPPHPRWDITDFGLGDFSRFGLTLINLATEPEYCEKLMFARHGQTTPCHAHRQKKEDLVCRSGELTLLLWPARPEPEQMPQGVLAVSVNGVRATINVGEPFVLPAGSRITLIPGMWHEFFASSAECIIGEISTANDDLHDNFFLSPHIGRFPKIEEDEPAQVRLISES